MPHNLFLHSEVIQSREWNLIFTNAIKCTASNNYFHSNIYNKK